MVRGVREAELSQLRTTIGYPTENSPVPSLPPAIFVWGPTSCGKMYFLNKALKKAHIHIEHIFRVSAEDLLSAGLRSILEKIKVQLVQLQEIPIKCQNPTAFHLELRSICKLLLQKNGRKNNERIVIVVAKAHLLLEHNLEILCHLQLCQRNTGYNICVIFVSQTEIPHSTTLPKLFQEMPIIKFPQYTSEELITIISKDYPVGPGNVYPVYCFYVSSIVNAFPECKDLTKFWNFIKLYHRDFERWRLANGDLTELCSRLTQVFDNEGSSRIEIGDPVPPPCSACAKKKQSSLVMPDSTKYAVIAAYLASRNPVPPASSSPAASITDPKPLDFTEARLQSIYSKLIGSSSSNSNMELLVSITALCYLKLLVRDPNSHDEPKYRCLAHRDFIKEISESIQFPLEQHLRLPI